MEERDVVLCTVTKIEGTSVFVNIEGDGEGSIVVSEIAPGRIRNLRDYVVPNKKIVCKVLKIEGGHVHLSLRRVTSKERQDLLNMYEAAKAIQMTLKQLLPEQWEEKLKAIQKEHHLVEFFKKAKEDRKLVEQFFLQGEIEKIHPLLKEKEKEIEIKKEFKLQCMQSDGILRLRKVLQFHQPGADITYLAASRFVLRLKGKNYKQGNALLQQIFEEIEKRAKQQHCEFEFLGK